MRTFRPRVRQPGDAVGVLARMSAAGNRRHVGLVLHAAGVRRAQAVGPDRPHEHGHGACLRGGAGAAGAVGDGIGVIGERFVEEDDASPGIRGARAQLVEALDDQHLGLEAAWRGRDRAAEPEDGDGVPRRARRSPRFRGRAPTSAPSPSRCARCRGRPSSSSRPPRRWRECRLSEPLRRLP